MFLESLSDSLTVLQELLGASHHTSVFTGSELVGSEVVDTVSKALLDEGRVKLDTIVSWSDFEQEKKN